jgi:5-formyltetrahydrofolate cyclo-ligase
MDKLSTRKALVQSRLDMPDRLARADLLQQVMRIWLVGSSHEVIGAYWPIKGEFDPLPALYRWQEDAVLAPEFKENMAPAQQGHVQLATESRAGRSPRKIGLPVVNKLHKTLTFHAWYPGCPMEEDAYGIPKPKDTEVIVPTLLFVPCVGYGPGGYRLGYGGGFYDRTLAALAPRPVTVGLGYSHGWLPDMAPELHDIALDVVLNDKGVAWPV